MVRIFITTLILLFTFGKAEAQFSIAAVSTNYSQDFNALTSGTWTNNTTLTGWYARTDATANITSYGAGNGATTTAGLYAFGTAGTNPLTDRALGFVASNTFTGTASTGKGYIGWRLLNSTGGTISTLTVTFTGEQWRINGNAAAQALTVEYQTGTTVTSLTAGTWTSVGSLTFTGPQASASTVSLDGNAAANRTASISATITFAAPIPAGQEVMIRWSDLNDSGNDHTLAIDDVTINAGGGTPCVSASEPTTASSGPSFSSISCTSMTLSWANGDGAKRLVVARAGSAVVGTPSDQQAYTANSVFGSGSTIAANEFIVYNNTGNTVTITGLSGATTYHFAIFEYNGTGCPASGENYFLTSLTGNQATSNCAYPQITGVLINACGGSCSEGDNEIIFMNSGSYSIPVSPANIIVKYDNSSPAGITYTDALTTNAGFISTMNSTANCGTLFYDAMAVGTIPANTIFMIMRSTACYGYDFTAFCGYGPVYVVFSNDASWTTSGNFSNGCTSTRYFRSDFSAVAGAGGVIDYSWDPCQLTSGGDGDAVAFPAGGGAANSYFNSGCTPPVTILPIELLSFIAEHKGNEVKLDWVTATETNNSFFTIQRTTDGIEYEDVAMLPGAGNSTSIIKYSAADPSPYRGLSYYRLKQTDHDGNSSLSDLVPVQYKEDGNLSVISNTAAQTIDVMISHSETIAASISIIDATGRTIYYTDDAQTNSLHTISTTQLRKGIYLVKVSAGNVSLISKIIN